jgi:TonB-linked SusC/RagA family outer membrane protein
MSKLYLKDCLFAKTRKFSCIITWLFLLSASALTVHGQITVKGVVTEGKSREPVVGAAVVQKSTTNGVATGIDGSFALTVQGELPVTLLVSIVGYRTQEIDVYDREAPILISLWEDYNLLDEIVVTGYTSQQRKFISGSVTSVHISDDLRQTFASDVKQLLQGKVSGVQILSNSGVPGGGVTFRIRGNNSINASVEPLYIIDGVILSNSVLISTTMGGQVQSNPLADINPADIENVVVLKDANATAIYGSLGANGVVVITTKKGERNAKAKVSLRASHGWSQATGKFEAVTGPETGILLNESAYNTAVDRGIDPSTITLPFADPLSLPTYDRISDIFRTAASSEYDLAVQGGNTNSSYYIGLGYTKQESVMKPSYFERFSGHANYDNNLTDKLRVGTSINISRAYRNPVNNDNAPTGLVNSTTAPPSYLPIYNEDGSYAKYVNVDNHMAILEHSDNNSESWRTIINLYGEYNILPELKFKSSWSLDNSENTDNNYFDTYLNPGVSVKGSATYYNAVSRVYTAEQLLTYNKTFGAGDRHNVTALLGNTINSRQFQSGRATGTGFATNDLREISVAATTTGSASSNENRLFSFFGKAGYTLNGKYTLDGSVRADASSRFGKNKRWGYFPSAGITWNAGEENFIKNIHVFDVLKFRGSIGYTGNQEGIGSYAALGLWSASATYLETAGISPSQLGNPDLTWETTRQADVGVEFAVLKNRLTVNFDYYNKYTYDLLLNVPVPYRSGFSSFLQNYGAVSNKGLELAIQSVNIETKKLRWTTDFNISTNRNRIEKLASDITLGGRNLSILREGYPVNSFYLFRQLYVDPQTGNAIYEDFNKDGLLTSEDRQVIGNGIPKYTGGLTNNISYRNFSLDVFFYFQQGNEIINMHDFFLLHGGRLTTGFIPRQLERWQKPGDITDIPRLTTYNGDVNTIGSPANNYGGVVTDCSTRFLEDGSFIRLKNLALGYTIPKEITSQWRISQLRATLSASNLLTFTKYGGSDPEVNAQSSNQNTQGYDWSAVPQSRTYQITLSLNF